MSHPPETAHRFRVHARHIDSHHARVIEAASFEAAAVAYVEDFSAPVEGGAPEISVVVRNLSDSHERCFRIDLGSGDTAPCP